ncbi:uncharacterized protein LOC134726527 [Mytilus trossulus]|uniref:uncharacterized protein LOC134726527 n=1 Tax=Mytilus trossulus TaxID=6551 RepID=UPI003006BEF4
MVKIYEPGGHGNSFIAGSPSQQEVQRDEVCSEFQNAKDHQVENIKDVGQPTVVEININKQYQTDLFRVGCMIYSNDDFLWISSGTDGVLQRVKPEGTKLNILSSFNISVYGMAITQSNNLLVSTGDSRLKQFSKNTGTLSDTVYIVSPFRSTDFYITRDNKVLAGCVNEDFPKQGRRVIMLMDQNGECESVYEHDQHKQPIFTYPWSITHTSNGNIHVVDRVSDKGGRVEVLGQDGALINIYTGDTEINKGRQFYPTDIVTTPRDNVIVADINTDTLHILNNAGLLITYYNTSNINIMLPYSLAFSPTGQLYIGCTRTKGNTTKENRIYEVTISRC